MITKFPKLLQILIQLLLDVDTFHSLYSAPFLASKQLWPRPIRLNPGSEITAIYIESTAEIAYSPGLKNYYRL